MGRARRIWKWTAASIAGVLVLAGIGVGVLRLWLEHSTTFAPAVVARVEQATGLRIEYSELDARLGLYGPEVVFRDARLYAPGEREPLASARAGRVGADWWRMLRTGRVAAGRVALEGARLHLLVTPRGVELRGQGPLWREDDRAPLRLDRLPVGDVRIEDATVLVEDTRTGAAPVQLDEVELEAERSPARFTLAGNARLPRTLGSQLSLDARLDGELGAPERIAWRSELVVKDAVLPGWAVFVPAVANPPSRGHGDLRAALRGVGTRVDGVTADVAFQDLRLPNPGGDPVSYRRVAGEFGAERAGTTWRVVGRDVTLESGIAGVAGDAGVTGAAGAVGVEAAGAAATWRGGDFDLEIDSAGGTLRRLRLQSPAIELAALAPAAVALPAGAARDGALALAPRGSLQRVDLTLTRGGAPREWRVDGAARFTGLGIGAWGRVPGLGGVTGELRGHGAAGTVTLRARDFELDLREYLAGPVGAPELDATIDWEWRPDGWRFATDDLRAVAPDGRGGGKGRLWLPVDGSSPRLVLDVAIADLDARDVPKYLPAKRLSPAVVAWLDGAFLAGRVPDARLTYAGEVRRFPFRDGGGEFKVVAQLEGLRVHYQDGWADLEDAHGAVTFRNEGFSATFARAQVNGLTASAGEVALPDYADPVLAVRARTRGDVADALAFLQRSPVGPRLGGWFMRVQGRGALDARVVLDLPFRRMADRLVDVDAKIERASARLPSLDDDARIASASFRLRNRDVDVTSATGTLLGGPFQARASTLDGARGERVLTVTAEGRAEGARIQPLIGVTAGEWLDGTVDWTANARIPRLEWRPDPPPLPRDAPPGAEPPPRESELRWLPMTIRGESTLAGLAVRLPAPLAKPADEVRAFRGEFTIDPGVAAGAPEPPVSLQAREAARPTTMTARLTAGPDAAVLAWRRDEAWTFERGSARFGGGTPALRDVRGLWVEGRVADLDLSEWLRVKLTAGAAGAGGAAGAASVADSADRSPSGVNAILRGGALTAQRFSVLGYEFPDVVLQADSHDGAWHATVDGPAARGSIVVPWRLVAGEPLVLDLDRLVLAPSAATRTGAGTGEPTDPRELPALRLAVRNLEVQKRRFGTLAASLTRIPEGLRLERGTLTGATFEVQGTGSWTTGPQGPVTRLTAEAKSTDVLETLKDWGFEPSISGRSGVLTADLSWSGGPDGDVLARLDGSARVSLQDGQLTNVASGAGRMLGLMSVSALPRRLALDFTDVTDKGFAYDTITGDFDFRRGDAHTKNLLLKSPAAEIAIVGRTGLAARDYDQTAVVAGHIGGPLAAAGALAGGPAVGAALLLFSALFDEPLSEIARGYYRITGSWDDPKVERIGSGRREPAKVGAVRE
jgi:uncharacterized protein YhdP